MEILTPEALPAFLAARPVAAIHVDADWDARLRALTRRSMLEAEAALGDRARFGEIDCDKHLDWAKSLPAIGVPLVAYYRNGTLVAALVGVGQDVRSRVERLLSGGTIGLNDGTGTTS